MQAQAQGIDLLVRPRFTRVVDLSEKKTDIHRAYELVSENEARNEQIIQDVRCCIQENRTPVILTKLKKHAKLLYDALSEEADRVFLLYGDNKQTQNQEIRRAMRDTPREKTMIVVATGQKIGEGFDCPRLDTLMLVASPVKFDGRLIQYVGRLNRTYEGKTNVIVYDYVEAHIPMFDNQYRNRLAAYKRIGYRIQSGDTAEKQTVNSIFDRGNYTEVFEQDLVEAEREIVVASPGLRWRKVERMLSLLATRQEAGVNLFDNSDELRMLIRRMRVSGVEVVLTESENEHYAVMDGKLVWHGGMNLLGREGAWDNLIGGKHPGCNGVAGDDGGSEIPPTTIL